MRLTVTHLSRLELSAIHVVLLLRPGRGAEYCDQFVCLSASISLELLYRFSRIFLCRSPVGVARSSSGGVAIRYVIPVLWMTSHLAVLGRMAMCGRLNPVATPIPGQSLMSMNGLFGESGSCQ